MRKVFVFVFSLFILFMSSDCAGPQQFLSSETADNSDTTITQLRVLSYNIHYARSVYNLPNLKRIAKIIRSTNPDIVALQEIDRGRPRAWFVDQVEKLEQLTGLMAVFGPNKTVNNGGQSGNAILSRFPVISHKNYLLPRLYGGQRSMLQVDLVMPKEYNYDDNILHFFNVHLEAQKKDSLERIASANFIEDIVQPILGNPMILAGDFNDVPESQTMSIFRNIWGIAGDEEIFKTFPSIAPYKQIDYILFHPKDSWKIVKVSVINEKIASDHRPVLAVFEWIGEK